MSAPLQQTGAPSGRVAFIDGWRGVAILLVLLTHAWSEADAPALSFHVGSHTVALAAIPAIGYVGVNLFLVLSGLCLAYPFMRDATVRERTTIWGFWRRRVRRIVPAYYASIVLVVLLWAGVRVLTAHLPNGTQAALPAPPTFADLWSHLLFVHNLSPLHASTINGSYWSLALEFQLYLLFPLLIEAAFRWGPWRVAAIVLAVQLAYRFTLDLLLWDPHLEVMTAYEFVAPKAILGRMFDFTTGITVAYVITRRSKSVLIETLTGPWAVVAGATCLVTAFAMKIAAGHLLVAYTIEDVLWAIGFGLLICWSSRREAWACRVMSFGPLVRVGLISYSIYLLHQPIIVCLSRLSLQHFGSGTAFVVNLACLPLVIAVSGVFFLCCEAPFLRKPKDDAGGILVPKAMPAYAQ